ncbi:MAG: rhamnulokinase [Spirochaetales bacterium]|nr:rhamnulokinase [Candidatus Physcosoma equi]
MDTKYALAIDIGASSGRHIVGWMEERRLETKEVFRFPNGVLEKDVHLVWDVEALVSFVKEGIGKAKKEFPLSSLAIDTWGVDYVLLKDDTVLEPVYAYRDDRTKNAIETVHRVFSREELYRHTGTQFQPFNTIYQLETDRREGRLEKATDLLMIPEYLVYRLTGRKCREYTNATTTGLVSAETGEYDETLLTGLGFPLRLFPSLEQPGTKVGEYQGIPVLLAATHDTASAVEGIPMETEGFYLSSGTWSLLGVKTEKPLTDEKSRRANFSNEGGLGYNRYQKNLMGMWMVNELRRELCPEKSFPEILKEVEESDYEGTVDPESSAFLSPRSMKKALEEEVGATLMEGDAFRCAMTSLALGYTRAMKEIEENTGRHYDTLYIVGGGARNQFLNKRTEEQSGRKVVALPLEATAIGNLMVQLRQS